MLTPSSYNHLFKLIQAELVSAQQKIGRIKSVTFWKLGRWIDLYLLHGEDRAKYGKKVYEKLEVKLGIGAKTLQRAVRFSRKFPIRTALSKLSWTHQLELLAIPDQTARNKLAHQAVKKNLTTRELKQEIKKKLAGKNSDRHLVQVPVTIFTPMQFTYRAQIKKVIDADTFKVRIDLGLGGSFSRQKIRLKGIDAPEAATPAGKKAKAYVEKVLRGLTFVTIATSKSDKYVRYLADVWYGPDEKYLNQELLDLGLAKVWTV